MAYSLGHGKIFPSWWDPCRGSNNFLWCLGVVLWALPFWFLTSVGDMEWGVYMEGPGPSSRKCKGCRCKAPEHAKNEALDLPTSIVESDALWAQRTHHVQCSTTVK